MKALKRKEKNEMYSILLFSLFSFLLELRTVYTTALWSAYQVDHGELETSITAAFLAQAGYVDIIAETNTPV